MPKALFTEDKYKTVSAEAKVLYGLLFDRMKVSAKNGWLDEDGNVFIYYSLEEATEKLGRCRQTVAHDLAELKKAELIRTVRTGCGKPSKIYVYDFVMLRILTTAS